MKSIDFKGQAESVNLGPRAPGGTQARNHRNSKMCLDEIDRFHKAGRIYEFGIPGPLEAPRLEIIVIHRCALMKSIDFKAGAESMNLGSQAPGGSQIRSPS